MRTRPRLLVVYPSCNIDVNPTMGYLLESLSAREIDVDVLLEDPGDYSAPAGYGPGIRLLHVPAGHVSPRGAAAAGLPGRAARRLLRPRENRSYRLRSDLALFPYLRAGRYAAVLAVDPGGAAAAAALNRMRRRPLVYLNFEVMVAEELVTDAEREMKARELEACRQACLVLIQDEERAELFARETGFPAERMVQVPVAPPPQETPRSDMLRRTLGIPGGRRIVLYFGSVAPWTCRDDLAEMAAEWPERYCLVLHSSARLSGRLSPLMRRLVREGRVFLSGEPVGRKQLAAMVASADFGLAPYRAVGDSWETGANVHHLGLSSGKVGFYALCGLPILARSLPVYEREFRRYGCGRVYRRVEQTGALLEEMEADYARCSAEARRFYRERLCPERGMAAFCERLLAAAGIAAPEARAPRGGLARSPGIAR